MTIAFAYPLFLLLLLAVPLFWIRQTNRVHAAIRSLVIVALVLALARPVLVGSYGSIYRVLVLDESASLTPDQRARSARLRDRWLEQLDDKKRAAVVVLGEDASERFDGIENVTRINSAVSSLGAVLSAAARQIPDGSAGVIFIVSDGLSTDRNWSPALQTLAERGIAVDVADLGPQVRGVYPTSLGTMDTLRVGQTARLNVHVVGKATAARVRLVDGDGIELAISRPFDSDGSADVALDFEPSAQGFLRIRAEVSVGDVGKGRGQDGGRGGGQGGLASVAKTFAVQPPLRLLYLGDRERHGAERLRELLGAGFAIDADAAADAIEVAAATTANAASLSDYSLVMLDDRPAAHVSPTLQQALESAIRNHGLGLLFTGGRSSFGAGGYAGTLLADTLPVELSQFSEKLDPSIALAIVIDTSGSMSGSRLELAKQVARLAARGLKAHDRVGIVEFYGNKQWALPMQSAANRISIDRALGRMQASGGTVMMPAVEEAMYGLRNVNTRYKHILIVTDAGIENADFESLIQRIVDDRINVSTVLVGSQAHSQNLVDIASWGHGRFYAAADRYSLPEVLFKQPSQRKLPEYRAGSFPVVTRGASGWWGEIERTRVPALSGYVETRARPGAQVLLEARGSAHPLMATWNYGLGRVTALMTEPTGPGTDSWRTWGDYGRWLARVIERTASDNRAFRFSIRRADRRVTITARRFTSDETVVPKADRLDATGKVISPLELRQVAPDRFMAELDVAPGEEVRVRAFGPGDAPEHAPGGAPGELLVSNAAEDVSPEDRVDPDNALDLQAVADMTAGKAVDIADPARAAFSIGSGKNSPVAYSLWSYALLLALLLYLAELIYRRWPQAGAPGVRA